jgi:hypothetical protein
MLKQLLMAHMPPYVWYDVSPINDIFYKTYYNVFLPTFLSYVMVFIPAFLWRHLPFSNLLPLVWYLIYVRSLLLITDAFYNWSSNEWLICSIQ